MPHSNARRSLRLLLPPILAALLALRLAGQETAGPESAASLRNEPTALPAEPQPTETQSAVTNPTAGAVQPAGDLSAGDRGTGLIIDSRGQALRLTFDAPPEDPETVEAFLQGMDDYDRARRLALQREEEALVQRRLEEDRLAREAAERAAQEALWATLYGSGPFAGYPHVSAYGWGGSPGRPPHRPPLRPPEPSEPLGPSPRIPQPPLVPPPPSFQLGPMPAWPFP